MLYACIRIYVNGYVLYRWASILTWCVWIVHVAKCFANCQSMSNTAWSQKNHWIGVSVSGRCEKICDWYMQERACSASFLAVINAPSNSTWRAAIQDTSRLQFNCGAKIGYFWDLRADSQLTDRCVIWVIGKSRCI